MNRCTGAVNKLSGCGRIVSGELTEDYGIVGSRREKLRLGHAALEREEDQIGAAANAEFAE
jgi:hypothetical protein